MSKTINRVSVKTVVASLLLALACPLAAQGSVSWIVHGRGFGHGVGMCQVGSYGMAQRGHTYREILTHYYTGVELGKARWKRPAARGTK